MDITKRLFLIRLIDKIENNREFAERIGIVNKSEFLEADKKRK